MTLGPIHELHLHTKTNFIGQGFKSWEHIRTNGQTDRQKYAHKYVGLLPQLHSRIAKIKLLISIGEKEETAFHFLGKCSATTIGTMRAHYFIFDPISCMQINELPTSSTTDFPEPRRIHLTFWLSWGCALGRNWLRLQRWTDLAVLRGGK